MSIALRHAIKCLLLSAAVLQLNPSHAQIDQAGRFELTLRDDGQERYKAAPLGSRGIMLYRRLTMNKGEQLELIKLDTTLQSNWKGYIGIDPSLSILKTQYRQDLMFVLMKDRQYIGGDFRILAVKLTNGDYGNYIVKNFIPFSPTEFMVTNEAAVIGGYYGNRPIVLYFSFVTLQARVLPGFFNLPGELNQLRAYPDGSLDVIVSAKNFQKRRGLWIRNYDSHGELVRTTVMEPEEDKHLLFGRSMKTSDGGQVVAGVYGRFTEYSRGIFIASVAPDGTYAIRYYNFAELENFFSYMKAKREKRVKERIARRTIKGKKLKFNYRFLIHDIVPYEDQLVMTGEAFYPHYVYPNGSNSYYRAYGMAGANYNPMIRNEMVFDGYQYTHAVVVGFGHNGQLLWDNSFEINDIKTMQLEQYVNVRAEKDRIVMMYLFENVIRSKIIRDSEVLEGKSNDQLKTTYSYEKVDPKSVESERLEAWYGDYFFAYGVQKLTGPGHSRNVFYINKIQYH